MIDYRNLYADELEYEVHSVINGLKIRPLVVDSLQLEVWVHGWCTSTNSIKIVICFQGEQGGVLMRESINHSKLFLNMHLHHARNAR